MYENIVWPLKVKRPAKMREPEPVKVPAIDNEPVDVEETKTAKKGKVNENI